LFTEMQVGNASPAQQERGKKKKSINGPSYGTWGRFLQGTKDGARTLGDFDTLNRFIVYGTGTLFDEFITFNTKIEDVGAFHE
jgi:hypothetical protein